MEPPSRPSGIPRPSKLPVLQQRTSQLFNAALRETGGTKKDTKPVETPRLSKRSSIASLPRANKEATPINTAPARKAVNGSKSAFSSSVRANARPSTTKTSSVSKPGQTRSIVSQNSTRDDEENGDQLGSLNGFRAASRQGFNDDAEPEEYDEQQQQTQPPASKPRKSRPSLSDRTIESLQILPTTPKDRRQSSFFSSVESPMRPPPRPGSSLSYSNSTASRPGTSDGTFVKPALQSAKKIPASAKALSRTPGIGVAPSRAGDRRSVSTSFTTKLQNAREAPTSGLRAPPPTKRLPNGTSISHSSKAPSAGRKATATPQAKRSDPAADPKREAPNGSTSSSAALRQQIAAAKAAAKKERDKTLHDSPREVNPSHQNAEMEMHFDPFNQAPKDEKHILRNRINAARVEGKLNISAMSLKEFPEQVMTMYSAAAIQESNVSWAELVDLTKLIAADNELDNIPDSVFPDAPADNFHDDDDQNSEGQFGGLELLDLHGNSLFSVPLGLRRLDRLTNLNLAHNKLENNALDIIAQIKSLRELRLGNNSISGNLSRSICGLGSLEVLDLQANRLLALPETIRELVSLRVLNVSGNQLTALPMEALTQLPLQELDASNNALIASLFPLGGPSEHRTLRALNVAHNSLAALTFSPALDIPELRILNVTNNHLTSLPAVDHWTKLSIITAGDNKISELPEGFTKLAHLGTANFSGNDLRLIPAEIARMESLERLILASNPLRDKKYLTMSAADIKNDLRARMEPEDDKKGATDEHDEALDFRQTAPENPTFGSMWTLKPNGVLDLSKKSLTDSINDRLGSFLQANEVRHLNLGGNKLTSIPPALWLGQDLRRLDFSNNPFDADYLSDDLDLPSLTELDVSNCRITALDSLTAHLQAPSLQVLRIAANRLSGPLPQLKQNYGGLNTLYASDNKITSISADSLKGFTTVDLASNDIQALPAEVGLLWDEGLRHLEIGRNAFRVPGYRVLDKGTEATMRWLRDRIPLTQQAAAGAHDTE